MGRDRPGHRPSLAQQKLQGLRAGEHGEKIKQNKAVFSDFQLKT